MRETGQMQFSFEQIVDSSTVGKALESSKKRQMSTSFTSLKAPTFFQSSVYNISTKTKAEQNNEQL